MKLGKKLAPALAAGLLAAAATATAPVAAQATLDEVLDVTPETQTRANETEHTLTAAVTEGVLAVQGAIVRFEIDAGPNDDDGGLGAPPFDMNCTTNAAGTCTVKYTDDPAANPAPPNNTDQVRAWIGTDNPFLNPDRDATEGPNEFTDGGDIMEPDETDVVTVTWTTPSPESTTLDTEPEDSLNLPSGSQELTASVVDDADRPFAGAVVGFLIEMGPGAGPASYQECQTDNDGDCAAPFNGPGMAGTNRVRSWVEDESANDLPDESDIAEMQPDDDEDNTDVVTLRWANEVVILDLRPEQDITKPGGTHTIRVEVATNFGDPQENEVVGVAVQSGPNTGAFDECTTGTDGMCTVSFSGTAEGTDEYLGWLDENDNNSADPGEADFAEGRDEGATPGATEEPDQTDVVENEWADVEVDVQPEDAVAEPGQEQVLTVAVTDGDGNPLDAENVDLEVEAGPNADLNDDPEAADLECDTGADGTCTVMYTGGSDLGTDRVRGWLDRNDDDSVPGEADAAEGPDEEATPGEDPEPDATDAVEVTWQSEDPPPPPDDCLGTEDDDVLIGTDGRDRCLGRGGDDRIIAKGGNDTARGGPGDDTLRMGPGQDRAFGQGGKDLIALGPGKDSGRGGPGAGDTLRGGTGKDTLFGGGGPNDTAIGGPQKDLCSAENTRGCEGVA